jgi:hypothetical protein
MGPLLSRKTWGTVREDYSDNGDAWEFINHDKARSNVYGRRRNWWFCDSREILCLAPAFGMERPYFKERLFGLTNNQGNHEKMLKNFIFKVSTPTHSYNKYLINILKRISL